MNQVSGLKTERERTSGVWSSGGGVQPSLQLLSRLSKKPTTVCPFPSFFHRPEHPTLSAKSGRQSPGQGPLSGEVVGRNKQLQTNGKRMQQRQWFFGGALNFHLPSLHFLHAFTAVIAPLCNTPAKSSQLVWPWPCSIPPSHPPAASTRTLACSLIRSADRRSTCAVPFRA